MARINGFSDVERLKALFDADRSTFQGLFDAGLVAYEAYRDDQASSAESGDVQPIHTCDLNDTIGSDPSSRVLDAGASFGSGLLPVKTRELRMAWAIEYTIFDQYCNNDLQTCSDLTTIINLKHNRIFRPSLGIQFKNAANSVSIICTDSSNPASNTDCVESSKGSSPTYLNSDFKSYLDRQLSGSSNYDLGHVLGGSGTPCSASGVARIGTTCEDFNKHAAQSLL